ncbi:MAG: Rrf2 family transcriptional regulator [Anaerolineae bacterium]|nr:Rrf2 family transcriptional regulator [Anaerolineae bacterium]
MFRISRRLDYGMQFMIALAGESENGPQSTASLAKKLSIPLPFLHQISHSLMQAGFIKATPGPRGGVKLNQPAASISARQIVEALEGPISFNSIAAPIEQEGNYFSSTSELWSKLETQVINYLDQQKLDNLAKNHPKPAVFSLPINKREQKERFIVN